MRIELFISNTSFSCTECKKVFELKGHWYNQMGIETYNDVRYCWHKLIKHPRKPNKKDLKYILKLHIVLPIVLLLELLNILCIPFRLL